MQHYTILCFPLLEGWVQLLHHTHPFLTIIMWNLHLSIGPLCSWLILISFKLILSYQFFFFFFYGYYCFIFSNANVFNWLGTGLTLLAYSAHYEKCASSPAVVTEASVVVLGQYSEYYDWQYPKHCQTDPNYLIQW